MLLEKTYTVEIHLNGPDTQNLKKNASSFSTNHYCHISSLIRSCVELLIKHCKS